MLQKIKYIWSLLFSAGMTTMKITSLVLVTFMIWGYYGENFSEKSPDFFVKLDQKQICGVVFGAAVWRDDKPSHALYDRTMTGIDLYKLEKTVKL